MLTHSLVPSYLHGLPSNFRTFPSPSNPFTTSYQKSPLPFNPNQDLTAKHSPSPSSPFRIPYRTTTTMPSPRRSSLSPRNPAELHAPNADYQNRPVASDLGSPTHISHHSHMSRYRGHALYSPMNVNALNSDSHVGPKPVAEDNIPNRFDTFLLGDGEKKVTEVADTRKSILWRLMKIVPTEALFPHMEDAFHILAAFP